MPTPARRLTREDWVDAAVAALSVEGADGVAVQPLARVLGATKGSFYWHFASRDELLRAALERWAEAAADAVIAEVELAEPGRGAAVARRRAEALLAAVSARGAEQPGELLLLAAAAHPHVAAAVERVTERHIGYLASQLRTAGVPGGPARQRATLAYAAVLGLIQFAQAVPAVLPARSRRALSAELAELMLA